MLFATVRDENGKPIFDDYDSIPLIVLRNMEDSDFMHCLERMTEEGKAIAIRGEVSGCQGEVKYTFKVLEDFFSEEFRSQYVKDQKYNVRSDNIALHEAVQVWQGQGKVEV